MPQHGVARSALGARNNAHWCAAVARAHGIASTTDGGLWRAHAPTPPGYPEAVTLVPGLAAESVVSTLPQGASSVKDSFADVDLAPFGFDVLFDARWIAREALAAPDAAADDIRFDEVRTPAALLEWGRAHGNSEAFVAPLLDDAAVVLLGDRRGDDFVAGAVLNDSRDAVGVSNVFGPTAAGYSAAVATSSARYPGRPVVGWERGDELDAARAAGFAEVGRLRVWVR